MQLNSNTNLTRDVFIIDIHFQLIRQISTSYFNTSQSFDKSTIDLIYMCVKR